MRYDYEVACREAGLDEEKIEKLRRAFDYDYKRLKRCNERRSYYNIVEISLDEYLESDEEIQLEIADQSNVVEEVVIKNWELRRLREIMGILSERDQEFLYDCFSGEKQLEKRIFEKYGMTRQQMRNHRERLIKRLRKEF